MKSILILITLFVPFLLMAQQPMDTAYPTGGCMWEKPAENYSFDLNNGNMHIYGIFEANCCGVNMLLHQVSNDTILIHKAHEGEYCYCMCYFPFDMSIENCYLNSYHVLIPGSDIDTIIYAQNPIVDVDTRIGSMENLQIYPNPTTGEVTILLPSAEADRYTTKIFATNGKLIKEFKTDAVESSSIDCSTLPRGVYFIRLFGTRNNQYNGKVIIE